MLVERDHRDPSGVDIDETGESEVLDAELDDDHLAWEDEVEARDDAWRVTIAVALAVGLLGTFPQIVAVLDGQGSPWTALVSYLFLTTVTVVAVTVVWTMVRRQQAAAATALAELEDLARLAGSLEDDDRAHRAERRPGDRADDASPESGAVTGGDPRGRAPSPEDSDSGGGSARGRRSRRSRGGDPSGGDHADTEGASLDDAATTAAPESTSAGGRPEPS